LHSGGSTGGRGSSDEAVLCGEAFKRFQGSAHLAVCQDIQQGRLAWGSQGWDAQGGGSGEETNLPIRQIGITPHSSIAAAYCDPTSPPTCPRCSHESREHVRAEGTVDALEQAQRASVGARIRNVCTAGIGILHGIVRGVNGSVLGQARMYGVPLFTAPTRPLTAPYRGQWHTVLDVAEGHDDWVEGDGGALAVHLRGLRCLAHALAGAEEGAAGAERPAAAEG
jgi:hypothetical protein